ncbi:MAG: CAP domain-containing protein [Chitinophagaceae bacterium]|nr:CAP domain-containing protein [Chitinophagaceae bacterium]
MNKHRKKKGLAPLESNFIITSEARRHTMEMATRRVPFGHNGIAYRSKFIRTKIPGVNAVAENVAYGSQSAEGVVAGWLNSAGHKKNIEGKYRITGIGVARDVKSQLYFTQIFAD